MQVTQPFHLSLIGNLPKFIFDFHLNPMRKKKHSTWIPLVQNFFYDPFELHTKKKNVRVTFWRMRKVTSLHILWMRRSFWAHYFQFSRSHSTNLRPAKKENILNWYGKNEVALYYSTLFVIIRTPIFFGDLVHYLLVCVWPSRTR